MTKRKILWLSIGVLAVVWAALTLALGLRRLWRADPEEAALAYLNALRQRDPAGIYIYSSLLGPRISKLLEGSNITDDERKNLWAKEYTRWQEEFEKGSAARDALRRERALITPTVMVEPVEMDSYRPEVTEDGETYLAEYKDVPGHSYHRYFKLEYPEAASAPAVKLLDNVRSGADRKIRSLVVRLEVQRRPEVGGPKAWLIGWDWLDGLAWLVPTGLIAPRGDPASLWCVELSFEVDKITLVTW